LDTGSAGDYIARRFGMAQRVADRQRRGDRIGICPPVLGELRAGVELSQTRDRNLARLKSALGNLVLWPFDKAAAIEFGRIFARLRRIGRPMQQIDIQVAAVAFSLGNCTVVSKDSDLRAIDGLDVEDWTPTIK
jgi:tRNA(fMet)-specific endonuclease VapC